MTTWHHKLDRVMPIYAAYSRSGTTNDLGLCGLVDLTDEQRTMLKGCARGYQGEYLVDATDPGPFANLPWVKLPFNGMILGAIVFTEVY